MRKQKAGNGKPEDRKPNKVRKDPKSEGRIITKEEVMQACKDGDLETVKKAVEQGFDINQRIAYDDGPDESEDTLLTMASAWGRANIVEFLIENGADLEARDDGGNTALVCAASSTDGKCIRLLIGAGADINAEGDLGNILEIIYEEEFEWADPELLALLLDAGADLNEVNRYTGVTHLENIVASDILQLGDRPLNEEKRAAYHESLRLILERCKCNDQVQFEIAVKIGNMQRMKELIGKVDVNAIGMNKMPPMQSALYNRQVDVVLFLMDNGADINAKSGYGITLLNEAAETGNLQIVKELLGRGCDPNEQSSNGSTALHEACYQNHPAIVRLLLEHGADTEIVDQEGNTPIKAAKHHKDQNIVRILESNQAN